MHFWQKHQMRVQVLPEGLSPSRDHLSRPASTSKLIRHRSEDINQRLGEAQSHKYREGQSEKGRGKEAPTKEGSIPHASVKAAKSFSRKSSSSGSSPLPRYAAGLGLSEEVEKGGLNSDRKSPVERGAAEKLSVSPTEGYERVRGMAKWDAQEIGKAAKESEITKMQWRQRKLERMKTATSGQGERDWELQWAERDWTREERHRRESEWELPWAERDWACEVDVPDSVLSARQTNPGEGEVPSQHGTAKVVRRRSAGKIALQKELEEMNLTDVTDCENNDDSGVAGRGPSTEPNNTDFYSHMAAFRQGEGAGSYSLDVPALTNPQIAEFPPAFRSRDGPAIALARASSLPVATPWKEWEAPQDNNASALAERADRPNHRTERPVRRRSRSPSPTPPVSHLDMIYANSRVPTSTLTEQFPKDIIPAEAELGAPFGVSSFPSVSPSASPSASPARSPSRSPPMPVPPLPHDFPSTSYSPMQKDYSMAEPLSLLGPPLSARASPPSVRSRQSPVTAHTEGSPESKSSLPPLSRPPLARSPAREVGMRARSVSPLSRRLPRPAITDTNNAFSLNKSPTSQTYSEHEHKSNEWDSDTEEIAPQLREQGKVNESEPRGRTLEEIGLAIFGNKFAARDPEAEGSQFAEQKVQRQETGNKQGAADSEKEFEFQGFLHEVAIPESPGKSPGGRMNLKPLMWSRMSTVRSSPIALQSIKRQNGGKEAPTGLARGGSLPVKLDLCEMLGHSGELEMDNNRGGVAKERLQKSDGSGDEGTDSQESAMARRWRRAQRKLAALHSLQFAVSRPSFGGAVTTPSTPRRSSPLTGSPLHTKRSGEGRPPRPGKSALDVSPDATQAGHVSRIWRAKSQKSASETDWPTRSGSLPKDMKLAKFDSLNLRAKHTQFQLAELKLATGNFEEGAVLGQGGFGKVYRGVLPAGGKVVAVKALKKGSAQGDEEFLTELELLSRLAHRNLVKLLGFCTTPKQRLLVYQFLPNGSLFDHLHGKRKEETGPLTWERRLRIALGTARGLNYLHSQKPQILHRDVKSSNILLTTSFEPKVADLGCARIIRKQDPSTQERVGADGEGRLVEFVNVGVGTVGHMAPEVLLAGEISAASDAFSFGVVLMELLTGKEAVDRSKPQNMQNLVSWALPLVEERRWDDLFDPFLIMSHGSSEGEPLCRVAALAEACLQFDPLLRPSFEVTSNYLSAVSQGKAETLPDLAPSPRRSSFSASPPSPTPLYEGSESSSGSDSTRWDVDSAGRAGEASEGDTPQREAQEGDPRCFPSPSRHPMEYAKTMQAMINLIEEGQEELEWSGGLKQYIQREAAA